MRQIALDTETTGINVEHDRIIEIAAIEIINRQPARAPAFHYYVNPERQIDKDAFAVHGISDEFLTDKPLFKDIAAAFIECISGSELIIHNAPFDIAFLNKELKLAGRADKLEDHCTICDTLTMAREKHPESRNNLDALCGRYQIDNSARDKHGALLDTELLVKVYLKMTYGQHSLILDETPKPKLPDVAPVHVGQVKPQHLRVIEASQDEKTAHNQRLADIKKASGRCLWLDQVQL